MAKNITVLEIHKDVFHLGDLPSRKEMEALGDPDWGQTLKGTLTGEFRPPKKGEWFLSGAIPTCYKARNDLTNKRKIVKLCKVRKVEGYELVK